MPSGIRQVSCLAAAGKVLEKVVCDQLARFAEVHGLLQNNQISVNSMLEKFSLLSANQLAAQIQEVWKSVNIVGYALSLEPYNDHLTSSGHLLRQKNNRIFNDTARL